MVFQWLQRAWFTRQGITYFGLPIHPMLGNGGNTSSTRLIQFSISASTGRYVVCSTTHPSSQTAPLMLANQRIAWEMSESGEIFVRSCADVKRPPHLLINNQLVIKVKLHDTFENAAFKLNFSICTTRRYHDCFRAIWLRAPDAPAATTPQPVSETNSNIRSRLRLFVRQSHGVNPKPPIRSRSNAGCCLERSGTGVVNIDVGSNPTNRRGKVLSGSTCASPFPVGVDPDLANAPEHPRSAASREQSSGTTLMRPPQILASSDAPRDVPATFFIFSDLCVRTAGWYRLRFQLVDVQNRGSPHAFTRSGLNLSKCSLRKIFLG
ncbi:hypothetical protein ACJ73_06415 [Blastomyces percursus]|uniref:Velvet domain-containing protein n=1 Tax=Blastomyces percursus TaxID=1658174 RepID=A0A1J9Q140_9EURO|nr:hypothetical protein ACJ73_06415 [Blastomyces percursus]